MRFKPQQWTRLRALGISLCLAGLASFPLATGAAEKKPAAEPTEQQRSTETREKKKRGRECEPITKASCRRNK